jgi:putative methyltransferase (TIGR04325 family)
MDDYKKALKIITDYNPNLIIFERTPFGKHPTYFTCQMNLGNAKIPCQMINYEEFKQIMSDSGYQLKYEYLGPFDRYIENLPPEYRPNTFADLIFEKENCIANKKKYNRISNKNMD